MATYFFETITSAQALAFNGQTDTLVFTNAPSGAARTRVSFNPASANGPATLTMLDTTDNHIVVFGVGLENLRTPVFPDGSALGVSIPTGEEIIAGPAGDGVFGIGGPDILRGLGGDDVLQGGQGADTLEGGAGSDLFLFAPLDSPAAAGQMDTIIDWSAADRLSFVFQNGAVITPVGSAVDYIELTEGNLASAITAANAQIAGGTIEYVSVQVGGDVTVTGGAGADLFHGSQDAGIDRVLDFSLAQGDRVMLDPGTTYTVSQVGADTVLDMSSGNQMILVGVSMSSLTASSIFFG